MAVKYESKDGRPRKRVTISLDPRNSDAAAALLGKLSGAFLERPKGMAVQPTAKVDDPMVGAIMVPAVSERREFVVKSSSDKSSDESIKSRASGATIDKNSAILMYPNVKTSTSPGDEITTEPDLMRESDRLTQRLKEVQQSLARRRMKADVAVAVGPDEQLAFLRKAGTWRLVWQTVYWLARTELDPDADDNTPEFRTTDTDLCDCSIERKARAAEALPTLLSEMNQQAVRRLEAAMRGNAALDAFEELLKLNADAKEGK
jgi:hypothetical protein